MKGEYHPVIKVVDRLQEGTAFCSSLFGFLPTHKSYTRSFTLLVTTETEEQHRLTLPESAADKTKDQVIAALHHQLNE